MARPWSSKLEGIPDVIRMAWAEFAAWEQWFHERVDEGLPEGEQPILDGLTEVQKAYLYEAMCDLADGPR